jgi:hypothetical protein
MFCINRTAIVVKPGQRFLDWLHAADPTSAHLTLKDLQDDPDVYLIRQCQSEKEIRRSLAKVCRQIFEEQLDGWYREPSSWPERRDLRAFDLWFEWSAHSIVNDLCTGPLLREDL